MSSGPTVLTQHGHTPVTLLSVDFWERGRERDRELLAWMWDDDARFAGGSS